MRPAEGWHTACSNGDSKGEQRPIWNPTLRYSVSCVIRSAGAGMEKTVPLGRAKAFGAAENRAVMVQRRAASAGQVSSADRACAAPLAR